MVMYRNQRHDELFLLLLLAIFFAEDSPQQCVGLTWVVLGNVRCRVSVTGFGRDEAIQTLYSCALAGGNLTLIWFVCERS